MGQADANTTITGSVEDVIAGTTVDIPSEARNVSHLISRNTKTLQLLFYALAFLQAFQNGYDASVMNALNILPSYTEYFTLTTATLSLNTASFWVGGILSGFVGGSYCDWAGRKWTMFWSSILCIIGAVIQGCAQNVGMFTASRIIIGFACGASCIGAATYLAETVDVRSRAWVLGFFWDNWWAGSLIAAGITFGTKSILNTWAWRAPSILQVLPSLLCIGVLPFVPESPRWLTYKNRAAEALVVLAVLRAGGDVNNPLVLAEHREIEQTLNFEKEAGSVSPLEVVRTAGNRKRILLCLSVAVFSMTMGNNVATYYLGTMLDQAGVTDFNTQLKVNIILSVWALVCSLVGTMFMDSLGRKTLALISTALATVFLFLVGGLSAVYGGGANAAGSYAAVAMMFLFLGSYSIGWTPLSMLYPVEVLNYSTRAVGMGMYNFFANGIGLMITFAFPYSFEAIGWKTYMVNSTFNAVTFLVVWWFWIETKGKTLEEMDELLDGEKHTDLPDLINIAKGREAP